MEHPCRSARLAAFVLLLPSPRSGAFPHELLLMHRFAVQCRCLPLAGWLCSSASFQPSQRRRAAGPLRPQRSGADSAAAASAAAASAILLARTAAERLTVKILDAAKFRSRPALSAGPRHRRSS